MPWPISSEIPEGLDVWQSKFRAGTLEPNPRWWLHTDAPLVLAWTRKTKIASKSLLSLAFRATTTISTLVFPNVLNPRLSQFVAVN
jgi:hypothetical protein